MRTPGIRPPLSAWFPILIKAFAVACPTDTEPPSALGMFLRNVPHTYRQDIKAVIIALLGFFWSPAFASYEVYRIPSPSGDFIQQSVTIDNTNQVANIHVYGGLCSSDTIFDYKHGYIATRVFSRRACFILKMEKGYVPLLQEIGRLAYEKQMMKEMISPQNVWVEYAPSDSFFGSIGEWLKFGSSIEQLCHDVPVYTVKRVEKGFHVSSCAKAGILGILGITVCSSLNV
ncbi:gastrokine-2 [Sceloporus undulatus]|uniref:gastrokine-2 n=1 Tax=Sceloporus undulatus TaxID=8520 RepID=UPI001C4CA49F|nr:gastrokine-2 [Sceloporus undulatus]